MAEFKIKKEKFDILLNLIAKTDNEELQNAFLDYQNEKNENNEGYLNYLKTVCEQGSSLEAKAALPLQNVSFSLPFIDLEQAEKEAMETDYACFAVGEEINTGDAGAFYLEGYNKARMLLGNES